LFIILGTAERTGERLRAGQAIYVRHETEGLWHIHCSRGKVKSITYSEYVSVVLCIQRAKGMRHNYIVICGLSGCSIFFRIIQ